VQLANGRVVPTSYPGVVQRGLRYIAEHLEESLTLTRLAGRLHVSRFYLCRLFRRHTGHTLSELVSRARLQRACELLADPALRVTEAAFAAGFGSIPHFNAVFKRHLGVAPTRYRQALRPG
jgi:AraC-like DNA-binding protein